MSFPHYINNYNFNKAGDILLNVAYSIIAACFFYIVSVFIPRRRKEVKVIFNIVLKTKTINDIIGILKHNLGIKQDIDFTNKENYDRITGVIITDHDINGFANWYQYLYYVRTEVTEIIRSITLYNDYLSDDYLHAIIYLENELFNPYVFVPFKFLTPNDFTLEKFPIRQVLFYDKKLKELSEKLYTVYIKPV